MTTAGATRDAWFPRPSSIEAIEPVGEGPRGALEIFALLVDPAGRELRERVGVAGPIDGAARASTRLLEVRGTILKTSTASPHATRAAALEAVRTAHARQRALRLWHPDKQWFVLPGMGGYLVASVCPRLPTVRGLASAEERLAAFARVLGWAWTVSREHDVGLDLNPANFAIDPARDEVVYIDDDLYPRLGGRDLGEAMAARVPEEPAVAPEAWESWARSVIAALVVGGRLAWSDTSAVRLGIETYPLVEAWAPAQRALASGARPPRRAAATGLGDRVCVFADVHANLVALEAVLAAAAEAGADSYLFLGDAVGYGPQPGACVARLASLERLVAVRGNHDHLLGAGESDDTMNRDARTALEWSSAQVGEGARAWLRDLPLEQGDGNWLAVHGAPRDPGRLYAYVYELTFRENLDVLQAQGVRLCFYGHTHVPFVHAKGADGAHRRLGSRPLDLEPSGTSYLVNPGSVGQPRDGDVRASFALWDRRSDRIEIQRVPYDVALVVGALMRAGLPADLGARLETGR